MYFSFVLCLKILNLIRFQGGRYEAAPDLDVVADVIEHIDRHGEPGNKQTTFHFWLFFFFKLCFKMMMAQSWLFSPLCFRCSFVFPPWMAGHQGCSRKTGGEAPFFLRLTDNLTM